MNGRKLRPVYREEIELMSRLVGVPLMARPADLVLWRSGREYYALGRKVFRLSGGSVAEPPKLSVHDRELMALLRGERRGRRPAALRRSPEETAELFREANSLHLTLLAEEAIHFLRDTREQYRDLPLVVSWSGGKDSTVASALAQEAFPDERIPHIFADTTIELPSTYEYLRDFRKANPAIPFLIGLPVRGFFDLCREIGPPSRIQRWCCTTHKAAPLADALKAAGGHSPVVSVVGLRRAESLQRRRYGRVNEGAKVAPQIQTNPLLDWTDFDVWAWHVARSVPLNAAYRYGFDRVGCAHCPNSGGWADALLAAAYPAAWEVWREFLLTYFGEAGVSDVVDYVASGAWRGRANGAIGRTILPGSEVYDVTSLPCQTDECSVTYELSRPFSLSALLELLRPFGAVSSDFTDFGVGHFHVVGPHGVFYLRAIPHWQRIRATFSDRRIKRKLEGALRLQLRKLQACIGCGGCASLCPHDAIAQVGEAYRIVAVRCVHCLLCVRGMRAGCRAADSLHARGVRAHA